MKSPHSGRVAIVTGCARGIGQGIALALASEGASLVLIDLDPCAETAERVAQCGVESLPLQADASSADDWARIRARVDERFGRADILVNNAGVCPFVEFKDLTYVEWRRVMQINFDSAFLGAMTFASLMASNKWGRIVNLASASVATEQTGLVHYIASKMGVVGLTRGLANDLAKDGITANAIAPAITNTPATAVIPEPIKRAVYERQPVSRPAEASEVAAAAVYLCSEQAAMVTGQTLMVSGGLTKL